MLTYHLTTHLSEKPVNLGGAPEGVLKLGFDDQIDDSGEVWAPSPQKHSDLTTEERMLLAATRDGDSEAVAGIWVRSLLKNGMKPADILQSIQNVGDDELLGVWLKALSDELSLPREPYAYKRDESVAAYELCIAASIVGKLALGGYLPPDFIRRMGGIEDMALDVRDWLLEGLASYGWYGSVREVIHFAQTGTPHDWASVDLAEQGGAE